MPGPLSALQISPVIGLLDVGVPSCLQISACDEWHNKLQLDTAQYDLQVEVSPECCEWSLEHPPWTLERRPVQLQVHPRSHETHYTVILKLISKTAPSHGDSLSLALL